MQKDNETAKWIVVGVVGVTALTIAYFGIIKPIFNAVGLTKDKDDREADKVVDKFTKEQYLTSIPYQELKNRVTISQTRANQLASLIYDAKGLFWDNESQAVGAIKDAFTKVNVSYVAYRFNQLYQRDLQSYLRSFLESENWVDLKGALEKMKRY